MANDFDSIVVSGLVDVVFVGGPLHGCRVLMTNPEIHMTMEPSPGIQVIYRRRMVEATQSQPVYRATYAPEGTTDEDFAKLVVDPTRPA